jgi:RNA-directed DNA polymerase
MSQVADRVQDKRVLKLIRAFLNAGVMDAGLVNPTNEGTPQGGPLSPLLSNLVLDELDQELERRGHRFCRYADDCNIYVRSERAGQRVMEGISRFITRKLRLKVNQEKSAVDRPQRRKFLGFRLTSGMLSKRCIAPLSQQRFRARVRSLTSRTTGRSVDDVVKRLNWYLVGWKGYYQFCQTPSVLRRLDSWIRRRLRQFVWTQWKTRRRRYRQLRRLGVSATLAGSTIASVHGPWRISHSPALDTALSDAYFRSLGLVSLTGGSHA